MINLARAAAPYVLSALCLSCFACPKPPPSDQGPPATQAAAGLRVAQYLLSQQHDDGFILDAPGWDTVNSDSSLEYALMGFAAAYARTHEGRYLAALEKGIRWLAAREEMTDPEWRGSWAYAYAAVPPYAPHPVALGNGVLDARAVDATSALFVYDLHLHARVSGSNALALEFREPAVAALDFLLQKSRSPDGFYYSSWHLRESDHEWHRYTFRYAADQGDVYLGMMAGWQLYGETRFRDAAEFLRREVPRRFFDVDAKRYAIGLHEDGTMERALTDFLGIFPQGYLGWVFGDHPEGQSAWQWLTVGLRPDGSLSCYEGDPRFSLTVITYALASTALGKPRPNASLQWLLQNNQDAADGGIRDHADPASAKYPNVAGFAAAALLEFPALP